ncbi:MAG: hypothetical protein MJ025_05780 [Victivallaceae bacterium]|nr:hypothetical protein [Victivallaceae bacterium]
MPGRTWLALVCAIGIFGIASGAEVRTLILGEVKEGNGGWSVTSGTGTVQSVNKPNILDISTQAGLDNAFKIETGNFEIAPAEQVIVNIQYAGNGSVSLRIDFLDSQNNLIKNISRSFPLPMNGANGRTLQRKIMWPAIHPDAKYVRFGLDFTSPSNFSVKKFSATAQGVSGARRKELVERRDARAAEAANTNRKSSGIRK